MKKGTPIALQPKAFDVLVVLVKNAGRLVTKDELLAEVWAGVIVEEGNVAERVSLVRKALGDTRADQRYIATVSGLGYRFVAAVREVAPEIERLPPEEPVVAVGEDPTRVPSPAVPTLSHTAHPAASLFEMPAPLRIRYAPHVIAFSLLYAALYVIALFVEVAYDYDRLGFLAWRSAPAAFAWIAVSSAAALWIDWRLTRSGRTAGLVCSTSVFVVASLLLGAVLGSSLPADAVTEASFFTYTAQAAFLKSCVYFAPLGVVYMALPFHLVVALDEEVRAGRAATVARLLSGRRQGRTPQGAIYVRVSRLVFLLVLTALVSVYGTAHLFDRLTPSEYSNLFMRLFQWRVIGYFFIGSWCVIWYYLSLNAIHHHTSTKR